MKLSMMYNLKGQLPGGNSPAMTNERWTLAVECEPVQACLLFRVLRSKMEDLVWLVEETAGASMVMEADLDGEHMEGPTLIVMDMLVTRVRAMNQHASIDERDLAFKMATGFSDDDHDPDNDPDEDEDAREVH